MTPAFIVAQLGARMHYAVPRILAASGHLERLFTDFCSATGWWSVLRCVPANMLPESLQRMRSREPVGVPSRRITAFNSLGFDYAYRRRKARTPTEATAAHLRVGREFCRRILRFGFGAATGVYTYNSAGLELLTYAEERGLNTIVEQTIAPKQVEVELLKRERERFPNWEPDGGQDALALEFALREREEWNRAQIIICASKFVREGISRCKGPDQKCVIVPYGVNLPKARITASRAKRREGRPLRVLTVGQVGLRKGSPYVLGAARKLKGKVEFRMVGSINLTRLAQTHLADCVELTGAVLRSDLDQHFEWADVFLLPSICEGSATVTYEALAHGLPVICTPNTGSVVSDGLEGFIIEAGMVEPIVEKLELFLTQPELGDHLAIQAVQRAREHTLEAYGARLATALCLNR